MMFVNPNKCIARGITSHMCIVVAFKLIGTRVPKHYYNHNIKHIIKHIVKHINTRVYMGYIQ
jgi:hypothetical protein